MLPTSRLRDRPRTRKGRTFIARPRPRIPRKRLSPITVPIPRPRPKFIPAFDARKTSAFDNHVFTILVFFGL